MAGISKRVSGSWVSGDERVMKTATDTITTLPADLYADGNSATIGLVGNMSQTGTPTPQNPIQPSECGDLETTGEHAGQYKIPISSTNTTTPVYLGEVETTRRIRKLVLTGQESSWYKASATNVFYNTSIAADAYNPSDVITIICSHYEGQVNSSGVGTVGDLKCCFRTTAKTLYIGDDNYTDLIDFETYLQQQYAAGTPVTIWYVLAEPTTGIVNEPLRKIGDYADTVSGITIPTISGADTVSVDTTLQPSEVSVTYHGWHEGTVKDYENGNWQPQAQALSLSNAPMLSMVMPDMSEPVIEPETTE